MKDPRIEELEQKLEESRGFAAFHSGIGKDLATRLKRAERKSELLLKSHKEEVEQLKAEGKRLRESDVSRQEQGLSLLMALQRSARLEHRLRRKGQEVKMWKDHAWKLDDSIIKLVRTFGDEPDRRC